MKLSKYNIVAKRDYGLLVYNSKTTSYVRITNTDDINHFKNIENGNIDPDDTMVQALYSRGFIVDNDCDEYAEVKKSIEEYFEHRASRFYFMVYVTENCNFRCIYCPQKHKPQVLSEENWDSLYTYIEKQVKNGKLKELNISFFGGEPLLEQNKIFRFLDKLKELKHNYPDLILKHDMTTNGYLLTKDVYNKLAEHNLKSFQITIDGFAKTHDKMRKRADGQGTWSTIIKNLEYINKKDDDIKVIIRMNYNESNKDSINDFYGFINKKFGNKKLLFDIQPITDFSENVDKNTIDTSTYKEKIELQNNLNKFERSKEHTLNPLRKLGAICKCSYKNSYTVNSEGFLTKCEHCYDNITYTIGKLDKEQGIIFNDNLGEWNTDFEIKECEDCIIYPLCAARSCPARKVFDKENRSDCDRKSIDVKKVIIDTIESGLLD